MVLSLGAINLDAQDLVVAKSVLRLRSAEWSWVDAPQEADLWLVDVDRDGYQERMTGLAPERLVALALRAASAERFAHWLIKPLKAMHLMRLLDSLARAIVPQAAQDRPSPAKVVTPATVDIPATPSVAVAEVHPWRGRKVMLGRAPNLARFPVSAEMLPWLKALTSAPIPYDELLAALPMDVSMIDSILDDAARAGKLLDGDGGALPPLPRPAGMAGGFWQRFK